MKNKASLRIYGFFPGALALLVVLALSSDLCAQKKEWKLPFRMANNLIILSAKLNTSDTLNFILDTGLKNSIICELDSAEIFELKAAREIRVMGLGEGKPAEATYSEGNILKLGGHIFPDQDFLVLSNDILRLSNKMGTKIHGMLSMQVFYDFVVEINYEHRILTLNHPEFFEYPDPDKYASLHFQIESGKPFLKLILTTEDGESYPVKLLLDSGASNALWLDINSMDGFSIPEANIYTYLGSGISGNVKGRLSRIKQVEIGPYTLENVVVSYPDSLAIAQQEKVPGRNGSLGSEILKRFNVILDFPEQKIYLQPNRSFKDRFTYDKSGLEVVARVPDQPDYIIFRVREGSVAWEAGIREGDRILSINNIPYYEFSLDDIYNRLLGSEGKRIRMVIRRGNEKLKFVFVLEDYI